MVLFYIFVLIPLITASYPAPSYRSSVMEGNKPILRMAAEPEEVNIEPKTETTPLRLTHTAKDEKMVKDVSLLIGWLIENFGYDIEPYIRARRNKDDPPENGLPKTALKKSTKNPKKKRAKKHEIKKPSSANEKHKTLRESKKHESSPGKFYERPRQAPEASWKKDLKAFIKDLITRFGQNDIDRYTKPVIRSLEKKYKVQITDIDVDQYGEIQISYINLGKRKKHGARLLRYRTPEDQ